MNRLKLVLPTPEYKEKIMDYKREFIEDRDSMDGTAGLRNTETFEEWYSAFCDNLKEETVRFGGHIGYSIRKLERQQGYATEILALALTECLRLNIKKVLITCDKENIASAKTIINNGGILENEIPDGKRITQRYWIIQRSSGTS